MHTDQTGPGLSAKEIRAIAPQLPDNIVDYLARQRVNVTRVHAAAIAYSEKLLDQTRAIRDKRLAEPKAQASAITEWENHIDALVGRGMSRVAATKKLVTEQPTLHANYLAAVNHRQRTA